MASSLSEQDDPNRALWLATWACKMEPSCLRWTTRCIPQAKFPRKPYNKSFINQVCSVKMTGYWPRSFLRVSSQSINMQKKELGQYPAILTSRLVNNPYIYMSGAQRPLLDLAFCIYLQREILILSGNSQGIWKLFLFVATMMYSIKFANTVCVCLLLIFTLWFPL